MFRSFPQGARLNDGLNLAHHGGGMHHARGGSSVEEGRRARLRKNLLSRQSILSIGIGKVPTTIDLTLLSAYQPHPCLSMQFCKSCH